LRDADREIALFDHITRAAPRQLVELLRSYRPSGNAASDPGAHYKRAEIGIKQKVDDPFFFGPGYSSPFNPWNPGFSVYLIQLFGLVAPLLELEGHQIVIDSGCGYAWTSEWLFRSGFDVNGVDICRTYLEIGIARMGSFRPNLIVADVENLPIRSESARAALAYESFHHVPDRRRAMAAYHRVLQDGGTVILAEPGAAHEGGQVAIDAMNKYGILEKGMELEDVIEYAAGTTFTTPEQLFALRITGPELNTRMTPEFVKSHLFFETNIFRLVKGTGPAAAPAHARSISGRVLDAARRRARRAWDLVRAN
jgi:SAM-dependent methyltransferase